MFYEAMRFIKLLNSWSEVTQGHLYWMFVRHGWYWWYCV